MLFATGTYKSKKLMMSITPIKSISVACCIIACENNECSEVQSLEEIVTSVIKGLIEDDLVSLQPMTQRQELIVAIQKHNTRAFIFKEKT